MGYITDRSCPKLLKQSLCSNGRVICAVRKGRVWLIPKNTPKPIGGRTKAAKQK